MKRELKVFLGCQLKVLDSRMDYLYQ